MPEQTPAPVEGVAQIPAPVDHVESHDADLPHESTAVREQLAKVSRQAKAREREYEQQIQEMKARLEEIDQKDQSELQKERRRREQLERDAQELSSRMMKVERQAMIRDAAREAKFDDPDDACAFIDIADVEDTDDAVRQVKELAKRKPKLLRTESPPSQIGQVVQNGQQVRGQQPQQGQRPQDAEMTPEAAQFLAQLQDASAASGWQSLPLGD